jgi:hypothetical protein
MYAICTAADEASPFGFGITPPFLARSTPALPSALTTARKRRSVRTLRIPLLRNAERWICWVRPSPRSAQRVYASCWLSYYSTSSRMPSMAKPTYFSLDGAFRHRAFVLAGDSAGRDRHENLKHLLPSDDPAPCDLWSLAKTPTRVWRA